MKQDQLERIAAAHGVAVEYRNARGEMVATETATLRKLLESMGSATEADEPTDSLPPAVVVVPEDGRVVIELSSQHGRDIAWTLTLESGERRTGSGGRAGRLELSDVPRGYHQLQLGRETAATLIVSPAAAGCPKNPRERDRGAYRSSSICFVRTKTGASAISAISPDLPRLPGSTVATSSA